VWAIGTNLMIQGRGDASAQAPRITRVRELLDAGVNVRRPELRRRHLLSSRPRRIRSEVGLIMAHSHVK